ncbi:RNA-guided endonuclease TnpB family protein [Actinomadura livida]|uniref:RNA-guided endonuclease TnpB family protein n=1 Tax=Actinomadura livida TaxID=79909 RepID=A0ABN1E620_9ACTN|nr:transposase [Actinomadura livida]
MYTMARKVKRGFKYRFYPTPEQATELARTFGCVRLVYNKALEERTRAYRSEGRQVSYTESSALLTQWKRTPGFEFLAERSSVPLQQALRHLQTAFTNFFTGRARYPVLKTRKRSRQSAEYTRSGFTYHDGHLKLAKMRTPLRVVWSRPLPVDATPSTVTVSRDRAGRWFVSLLCEDTIAELTPAGRSVGVDVGISSLATLSTGQKIANPRPERRARLRLTRVQRDLARKLPGSANQRKAQLRVARAHAQVADQRRDFLHKLTTRLVRENQTVAIEDLSVRSLMKNHSLARAISDAAWGEFRRMLEYKAEWYGRTLILVDRWFPSTKLCSECGHSSGTIPLPCRQWVCEFCGAGHDRDINAARNIIAAGPAERVNACGADVRPQGKLLSRRAISDETGSPAGDRRESPFSRDGEEVNT